MIKLAVTLFLAALPLQTFAEGDETGTWNLSPQIGLGYNTKQGANVLFGLDFGLNVGPGQRAGAGGYFSYGGHPARDREWGVGPFYSYTYAFTEEVYGHVREEIDYLDVRNPVNDPPPGEPDFVAYTGIASITSLTGTYFIHDSLGITAGIRLVLGLTNDKLSSGRSGLLFGVVLAL
jgi:hypothetical protein